VSVILEAKVRYLVNKHGAEAVAEAIMNIVQRDLLDVSPETRAWMQGRRDALAAAARKFNLLPFAAGDVTVKGRRN
jgi:hypothetical protein